MARKRKWVTVRYIEFCPLHTVVYKEDYHYDSDCGHNTEARIQIIQPARKKAKGTR